MARADSSGEPVLAQTYVPTASPLIVDAVTWADDDANSAANSGARKTSA
jgi:hypothetical protein